MNIRTLMMALAIFCTALMSTSQGITHNVDNTNWTTVITSSLVDGDRILLTGDITLTGGVNTISEQITIESGPGGPYTINTSVTATTTNSLVCSGNSFTCRDVNFSYSHPQDVSFGSPVRFTGNNVLLDSCDFTAFPQGGGGTMLFVFRGVIRDCLVIANEPPPVTVNPATVPNKGVDALLAEDVVVENSTVLAASAPLLPSQTIGGDSVFCNRLVSFDSTFSAGNGIPIPGGTKIDNGHISWNSYVQDGVNGPPGAPRGPLNLVGQGWTNMRLDGGQLGQSILMTVSASPAGQPAPVAVLMSIGPTLGIPTLTPPPLTPFGFQLVDINFSFAQGVGTLVIPTGTNPATIGWVVGAQAVLADGTLASASYLKVRE